MQTTVNLGDVLIGLGAMYRDRPALITRRQTVTFDQLAARAAQSAHELRARGMRPGQRIGLATRDGLETMTAMFALWLLDATCVPFDFRTGPAELLRAMEDFDIAGLLCDRPVAGSDAAAGRFFVTLGAPFAEARARHPARPPELDPVAVSGTGITAGITAGNPALIGLTSGTTGTPLGVVLDHASLLSVGRIHQFQDVAERAGGQLQAPRRAISVLPLSFGAARNQVLARLLDGIPVELFPPVFDPGELVDTIRNSGAEYLFCVPTIMRSLLDLPDRGDGPLLAGVRVLQVSGAELSPHEKIEMQRRICSGFVFEYASQLSGAITALTGPDVTARPETVGRLFAQARVEIVDETGQPVPPGTVGQIRARSPRMARMLYGGRDRAQGDRIRGGWVYPGDLGALDADGFLTLSGRASDVIIRGGANVHPAEIEEFIARLPGVGEVAAVGFPSRREGEEIAVFVIRAPGATLEMNDVLSHCRAGLAPDKRPRKVIFIEELPRNANGKLVRRTLAERAAEEG